MLLPSTCILYYNTWCSFSFGMVQWPDPRTQSAVDIDAVIFDSLKYIYLANVSSSVQQYWWVENNRGQVVVAVARKPPILNPRTLCCPKGHVYMLLGQDRVESGVFTACPLNHWPGRVWLPFSSSVTYSLRPTWSMFDDDCPFNTPPQHMFQVRVPKRNVGKLVPGVWLHGSINQIVNSPIRCRCPKPAPIRLMYSQGCRADIPKLFFFVKKTVPKWHLPPKGYLRLTASQCLYCEETILRKWANKSDSNNVW